MEERKWFKKGTMMVNGFTLNTCHNNLQVFLCISIGCELIFERDLLTRPTVYTFIS